MNFRETIFLTGFPGFIAGRLVKRLAKPGHAVFSARSAAVCRKSHAATSKQLRARTNVPLENFALIEGDITRENLGMSEEDLETVQARNDRRLSSRRDLRFGGAARNRASSQCRRHEKRQRVRQIAAESAPLQLRFNLLCRRKTQGRNSRNRARTRRGFSQFLRGNKISGGNRSRRA